MTTTRTCDACGVAVAGKLFYVTDDAGCVILAACESCAQKSERKYRVVWTCDHRPSTHRLARGVHCPGPFTLFEAYTVLSKCAPHPDRSDRVQEIPPRFMRLQAFIDAGVYVREHDGRLAGDLDFAAYFGNQGFPYDAKRFAYFMTTGYAWIEFGDSLDEVSRIDEDFAPVQVLDLDTGETYRPRLTWEKET